MKKLLVLLMAMLLACTLAFSLVGCGEHEHTAGDKWESDATNHWHVCTGEDCTEALDKAAHADEDAYGKCDVCDYVVHAHDYATAKSDADKHWNECSCGAKADEAAHADANDDGKCDTCQIAMPMDNGNDVVGGDVLDGEVELPEENV